MAVAGDWVTTLDVVMVMALVVVTVTVSRPAPYSSGLMLALTTTSEARELSRTLEDRVTVVVVSVSVLVSVPVTLWLAMLTTAVEVTSVVWEHDEPDRSFRDVSYRYRVWSKFFQFLLTGLLSCSGCGNNGDP